MHDGVELNTSWERAATYILLGLQTETRSKLFAQVSRPSFDANAPGTSAPGTRKNELNAGLAARKSSREIAAIVRDRRRGH